VIEVPAVHDATEEDGVAAGCSLLEEHMQWQRAMEKPTRTTRHVEQAVHLGKSAFRSERPSGRE
jgi:hypothetical protein